MCRPFSFKSCPVRSFHAAQQVACRKDSWLRRTEIRINLRAGRWSSSFHRSPSGELILRDPIAREDEGVTFDRLDLPRNQICDFDSFQALTSKDIRYSGIRKD